MAGKVAETSKERSSKAGARNLFCFSLFTKLERASSFWRIKTSHTSATTQSRSYNRFNIFDEMHNYLLISLKQMWIWQISVSLQSLVPGTGTPRMPRTFNKRLPTKWWFFWWFAFHPLFPHPYFISVLFYSWNNLPDSHADWAENSKRNVGTTIFTLLSFA